MGNKIMKIKLANMLRGKERKKEQKCKVKYRQMKKIYMHKRKTWKKKEKREKKGKLHRTAKAHRGRGL